MTDSSTAWIESVPAQFADMVNVVYRSGVIRLTFGQQIGADVLGVVAVVIDRSCALSLAEIIHNSERQLREHEAQGLALAAVPAPEKAPN